MSRELIVFVGLSDPREDAPHQAMGGIFAASLARRVVYIGTSARHPTNLKTPIGVLWGVRVEGTGLMRMVRTGLALLAARRRVGKRAAFWIQGSPNAPAALVALLGVERRRVIYHTQDFLEPNQHRLWEAVERTLAKRAGRVICNVAARARVLSSVYGLRQVPDVIPTALPRGWPTPSRSERERAALLAEFPKEEQGHLQFVIAAGGPYCTVRCGPTLLRALGHLPRGYGIVFTGELESRRSEKLKKDAMMLGVERRVLEIGGMSHQALLAMTAACDVGILLYENDGIGNFFQAPGRLTEYARCGLPAVASRHPNLELAMLKYSLGVTCNERDAEELAGAIRGICEVGEEEARERRLRLSQTAVERMAYDLCGEKIDGILRLAFGEAPFTIEGAVSRRSVR